MPRGHPNFGLGGKHPDEEGQPLLRWDPEVNRVSISLLLPSWMEQETSSSEAFVLGFGLYNRVDASIYDQESTKALAHEAVRAQLRAFELAHILHYLPVAFASSILSQEARFEN
ncbi:hypothetical protein KSP39_PZI002445 [Platanthera zijinensis]|uniref:Uncharacterized protein n=1 Tax=Platanthera zijinensis TaxID=2320716 RepID=A0AAP0BZG6_9ASPA